MVCDRVSQGPCISGQLVGTGPKWRLKANDLWWGLDTYRDTLLSTKYPFRFEWKTKEVKI